MRQNHPKSMALTSHVVLVLERSCYGWGHIMRISDSIFVNKSRYGVHTLNLGGSKCPTIALSESLDMSPPMHQDSRKNRGKNAPLGIFCQINF